MLAENRFLALGHRNIVGRSPSCLAVIISQDNKPKRYTGKWEGNLDLSRMRAWFFSLSLVLSISRPPGIEAGDN